MIVSSRRLNYKQESTMQLPNSVLFLLVLIISECSSTLIETFWESTQSWETNGGLWHVPLAGINVGVEGSTDGVNVVTVAFADTCAEHCQEDYPDEFCSRYPPEGVPEQPRTVDDWGTKFNRTSTLLAEGIQEIQRKGGKVRLAYGGGRHGMGYGNLGGENGQMGAHHEDCVTAKKFAQRVKANVDEWGFDGVDFSQGQGNCLFVGPVGLSASFHFEAIKHTRKLLGPEKSLSYTILYGAWGIWGNNEDFGEPYEAVILAGLRYLDYVTVVLNSNYIKWDENLVDMLLEMGIPANKLVVGIWMQVSGEMNVEEAAIVAENIKAKGLRGLMIFSANQEYEAYQGQLFSTVVNVINQN